MTVYVIIEVEVKDPDLYAEYVDQVPAVIARYGGRYLVRGGKVTPLSPAWQPERLIVIEFDRAEQMRRCFSSAEYAALAPLREGSTVSRAVIVEGLAVPEGGEALGR
jgi:uncharacterized protein (DUF1330 family)